MFCKCSHMVGKRVDCVLQQAVPREKSTLKKEKSITRSWGIYLERRLFTRCFVSPTVISRSTHYFDRKNVRSDRAPKACFSKVCGDLTNVFSGIQRVAIQ